MRAAGAVLLGHVDVPAEACSPGPRGARVYVVDYDATSGRFLAPAHLPDLGSERAAREHAKRLADPELLEKRPELHAINAYATVMSVLGHFERALGRRLAWGFGGHQIHVAPHAFADANAYYSEDDRALLFGYFPFGGRRGDQMVFTCLSHDVVAHESAHALLDGLRDRYTDPSSPDQAAFHEAFADVIALLSVFSMPSVVEALLEKRGERRTLVRERDFDGAWLKRSPLLAMAEQFGQAVDATPHRGALRASLLLEPSRDYYGDLESFGEEHRRAEILVAAMLRAFVAMWKRALFGRAPAGGRAVPLDVVVTEGCELADRLLTMVIRAIDYAPVVDVHFGDFLTALVTADRELYPRDDKYRARPTLLEHFAAYGIDPAGSAEALWDPPQEALRYDHIHPDSLHHDPTEVFRFLWENRGPLGLDEEAYTQVLSVRPCLRRGADGFWLHETVCEYVQLLRLRADELGRVWLQPRPGQRRERLHRPEGLENDDEVTLNGGGVLLFDEAGRLKYHVRSRVRSARQGERLEALANAGRLGSARARGRHFAGLHRAAATRWASRPIIAPRKGPALKEIW